MLTVSNGASYISRAFWSTIRSKQGTYIYRGFSAARVASGKSKEAESERRSQTHSRRGSSSSQRSVGAKEPSLLKKTVSRDQHSTGAIVSDALKTVHLGEKELLGAEKALNEFRNGIKGKSEEKSKSDQAIEEEFLPVVCRSCYALKKVNDRWMRTTMTRHVPT